VVVDPTPWPTSGSTGPGPSIADDVAFLEVRGMIRPGCRIRAGPIRRNLMRAPSGRILTAITHTKRDRPGRGFSSRASAVSSAPRCQEHPAEQSGRLALGCVPGTPRPASSCRPWVPLEEPPRVSSRKGRQVPSEGGSDGSGSGMPRSRRFAHRSQMRTCYIR
jgi:hypothetical protein